MPVYEYQCQRCQAKSSHLFRSFSSVSPPCCPECGSSEMRRLVSLVADIRGGTEGSEPFPEDDMAMGEWDSEGDEGEEAIF